MVSELAEEILGLEVGRPKRRQLLDQTVDCGMPPSHSEGRRLEHRERGRTNLGRRKEQDDAAVGVADEVVFRLEELE